MNVILISPRKTLIENKAEQNPNCFYFKPIELTRAEKKRLIQDIVDPNLIDSLVREECYRRQYELLSRYINNEKILHKKILVTNDSFPNCFIFFLFSSVSATIIFT